MSKTNLGDRAFTEVPPSHVVCISEQSLLLWRAQQIMNHPKIRAEVEQEMGEDLLKVARGEKIQPTAALPQKGLGVFRRVLAIFIS